MTTPTWTRSSPASFPTTNWSDPSDHTTDHPSPRRVGPAPAGPARLGASADRQPDETARVHRHLVNTPLEPKSEIGAVVCLVERYCDWRTGDAARRAR